MAKFKIKKLSAFQTIIFLLTKPTNITIQCMFTCKKAS